MLEIQPHLSLAEDHEKLSIKEIEVKIQLIHLWIGDAICDALADDLTQIFATKFSLRLSNARSGTRVVLEVIHLKELLAIGSQGRKLPLCPVLLRQVRGRSEHKSILGNNLVDLSQFFFRIFYFFGKFDVIQIAQSLNAPAKKSPLTGI